MSAPIDDLLYGGDDSGDEEMNASVPMRSFSTPLPLTTGLAPLPMATVPNPMLGASGAAKPLPLASAPISAPAAVTAVSAPPAIRPQHLPGTAPTSATPSMPAASAATAPATSAAAPATGAKKAPGSGQQMFQQMFALLKQMLPAEQYATLHSEMRKGNGNDIKSIVDIIKRIAGDTIFSKVIQKMDLTRSFPPTTATPTGAIKAEPAAPQVGARTVSTPPSAGTAAHINPTGMASAVAPPAFPGAMAATGSSPNRLLKPAGLQQRPALLQPAAKPGAKLSPGSGSTTVNQGVTPGGTATMKAEPAITAAPTMNTTAAGSGSSTATTATTPASTSAATTPTGVTHAKNEALEKILYAKRLLVHAAGCTLTAGVCQFKKCDDVRRVFKHSASCGGANNCTHCEQLKGLVKYHAKECQHTLTEHCNIPFCDGLRRAYASASAALGGPKANAGPAHAMAATRAHGSVSVTSDDDDDNTPLSSAVNKVKKTGGKSKSPKSPAGPKAFGGGTPGQNNANGAKKKAGPGASASPKPTTPVGAGAASLSSSPGSKGSNGNVANQSSPGKGGNTAAANMTLEYGRLLQLILHVQKCTSSACPVGQECADAKSLLQQVNSPNAPARAKTYKQVYSHYKVCLAKNNTANCPMCKIGLRPILPTSTSSQGESPQAQPAAAKPASAATVNGSASTAAASAASPSAGALKRTNSMTTPSPRSPSKKQRIVSGKAKSGGSFDAAAGAVASSDASGNELIQASVTDIRKEADVLTHTGIDLSAERRTMMGGARAIEELPCKKEEWVEKDLFNSDILGAQMGAIGRRCGVKLGAHTKEVMAYALHEYLKQVMEEMVEASKQRSDAYSQSLTQIMKKEDGGNASSVRGSGGAGRMELTATDILRVSCEDSFAKLRQEDLALQASLLDEAKREEMVEKERAKKRKKVDRSKLAQEEKDEAEMDIEELATKDLKERLLQEDKEGITRVDGRVNESIAAKYTPRPDHQVTMEDASYWLQNQKPYVKTKLFARAEVARVVTKALI